MAFLMFYVTHPDEDTARRIAEHLVQTHAVACANIFPIKSVYWWNQSICSEGEWVSVLKTTPTKEKEVERTIRALHPYHVPCILRFEVRANEDYEQWIEESTAHSGQEASH